MAATKISEKPEQKKSSVSHLLIITDIQNVFIHVYFGRDKYDQNIWKLFTHHERLKLKIQDGFPFCPKIIHDTESTKVLLLMMPQPGQNQTYLNSCIVTCNKSRCQISKRYGHYNIQSRVSEISCGKTPARSVNRDLDSAPLISK